MKQLFNVFLIGSFLFLFAVPVQAKTAPWWDFQSVDTMKYSRDLSNELLDSPDSLLKMTDEQVKSIANTGATHVAIATPYDSKFLPVLKAWVAAARKYHLNVWFRGNWSGWEKWFDFPSISREEHLRKTVQFIKDNPSLFENGDYFSACPECENGGPGDPRRNGDVEGHRKFLIDEYNAQLKAFRDINKNVQINLNSMNGDVARLVMDKATTKALGGQVVVDHYVAKPETLNEDITAFAEQSGGRVLLGEFGAPIGDINGKMTEVEQAEWLKQTLSLLVENPNLYGLSYWTNMGGSTALWHEDGSPKKGVEVLQSFYTPATVVGKLTNPLDQPLSGTIQLGERKLQVEKGEYELPYLDENAVVKVSSSGYESQSYSISELLQHTTIELTPNHQSWWYRLQAWAHALSKRFFSP